jgi:hypothetical protein
VGKPTDTEDIMQTSRVNRRTAFFTNAQGETFNAEMVRQAMLLKLQVNTLSAIESMQNCRCARMTSWPSRCFCTGAEVPGDAGNWCRCLSRTGLWLLSLRAARTDIHTVQGVCDAHMTGDARRVRACATINIILELHENKC